MSSRVNIFRPWTSRSDSFRKIDRVISVEENTMSEDNSSMSTSEEHCWQQQQECAGNFYDSLNLFAFPQIFDEWPDSMVWPAAENPCFLNSYLTYSGFPDVCMAGVLPKLNRRPKKYSCPHCKVSFSNNGQLKGHVRIHTGERPFKCDQERCGKSFTRNEELTRHKRIHTGLRPYPCQHCGKPFGRKDHLKKHVRTHFPQPRYADHPVFATNVAAAQYLSMYPLVYGVHSPLL